MNNNWIKLEVDKDSLICNAAEFCSVIITNGEWVEVVEEHGWDDGEYYFHDGTGQIEDVTHFMPFPEPPKKEKNND